MAVPTYTTDLITLVDFDGTPTSPTVAEPSTWAAGRSPVVDTDFPIQGVSHCSLTMNVTGKGGAVCSNTSSFTWTSGNYLFGWIIWLAPGAIATRSSGGLALICGSSISVYKVFYVGGSDFGSYPYGGWQNFAVDPTMTGDETSGAPSSYYVVGGGANVLSAVAKGNPFGFDVFRYGRGEIRVAAGQAGSYATFAGMATTNDNTSNRWGLFQSIAGGYKFKGLMVLGYGALTNFTDSNVSIVIDNSLYVQSTFNTIEIRNASSVINWTNISISSLCTVSRGNFVVTDNATINLNTCTFTDMGTFTFQSNTTITNCTFRRCNLITKAGSNITFSTFDTTNDTTTALIMAESSNPLINCTFISGGTKHAVQITAAGTYTFTNNVFTGYATSNGSTGNEVIYNSSGGLVTINYSGGSGTISYRNSTGSTTALVNSISISIHVTDESNANLNGAFVYIDDNDTAPFIMNTTTNSSGIATGSSSGVSSGTLRVRKYGYKPYTGSIPLTSNQDQSIVLVSDPVQDALPQDLSSYYTINTTAKTITSVGNATYTVKEYYKWIANTFAATAYMQYTFPMSADTSTVFNFTNSWAFGTPTTDYKYLTGGAITSSDSNSLWSNIFSLGTIVSGTILDVYQNDAQITPWWSSGQIDILVLVKSSGTLIDSGYLTVLARKYTTLYDNYIVDASVGGRTPIPLAAFNDSNNQTAEGTVGASPYTNITVTFGYSSHDLSNGNGLQPYDVAINCVTLTIAQVYEYLKYLTRTGSGTTFFSGSALGINGEFYEGAGDIRFNYDTEGGTGTAFSEGEKISVSSTVFGYLTSLYDAGTTGTMLLRNVHGTFTDNQTITGGTTGRTALVNGTITTIDKNKQSPFGTFAGGKFFGARGVWIYNMAGADVNSYQLTDANNITQTPPLTVILTTHVQDTNQVAIFGAKVQIFQTSNPTNILLNTTTNSSGEVALNPASLSVGTNLTIRVRMSSIGSTRYLPTETYADVPAASSTITVTLNVDTIASTS